MAQHNDIGLFGENQACLYLEENGFEILARNYRFKKGEIDIVAYKKPFICFVEVKTRTTETWGKPEEAIDSKKEKLLIQTANQYLENSPYDEMARFDVISVIGSQNNFTIEHFMDAIQPSFS